MMMLLLLMMMAMTLFYPKMWQRWEEREGNFIEMKRHRKVRLRGQLTAAVYVSGANSRG